MRELFIIARFLVGLYTFFNLWMYALSHLLGGSYQSYLSVQCLSVDHLRRTQSEMLFRPALSIRRRN
jgi:hypothetical protein